jgi:hypothetical protein
MRILNAMRMRLRRIHLRQIFLTDVRHSLNKGSIFNSLAISSPEFQAPGPPVGPDGPPRFLYLYIGLCYNKATFLRKIVKLRFLSANDAIM